MLGNIKYKNENGGEIEFDISAGIVISEIDGLTENNVKLSTAQGLNQIGSTVNSVAVQGKEITIEGAVLTTADSKLKSELLLNTVMPGLKGTLIYNDTWTIDVYPTETPYVQQREFPKFQFTLSAPYPYWSRVAQSSHELTGLEPRFTFPWDLSQSFIFGERIQKVFTNVENGGNVEALYTVIFRAVSAGVTNPKIENAMTYEYLQVNKEMELNEKLIVTITPSGVTVISNINGVETDSIGYFDIESTLYRMHPGDNIIKSTDDTGGGSLDTTIVLNEGTTWVRGRNNGTISLMSLEV